VYIFAIPASIAINIVAITIENILTLLNAEIIKPVTKKSLRFLEIGFSLNLNFEPEVIENYF